MEIGDYQKYSRSTAHYPNAGENFVYPTLGLAGEAGEVAEKVKKIIRNDDGTVTDEKRQQIQKELGDVLWYVAQVATEFGLSLEEVAQLNLEKLADRDKRGVIASEGDDR